jgi:hypothetical protein
MKKVLLIIGFVLFLYEPSSAQSCSKFYPMAEGTTFQYTNYNKKGKTEGVANYKVTDVSVTGETTQATMTIDLRDEKGKELFTTSYTFSCSDNKVVIDYESLMPGDMIAQMGDMEMEISGNDIEVPNDLTVGETLPDANVTMTMSMAGMKMKTVVNMINRKVEKKETVTTAAGTYDCYVIYSESQIETMGMSKTFPSRLWLAEGVGMVKQESYQKDNDLTNRTELTAFTQ